MQSNTLKLILRERGEQRQSLKQALKGFQTEQAAIFAVGPEGGWTDSELDAFEQAGFLSVSLGTRILRSETAAVAAMAALVYEFT
jgi:16S rRNA (uracil1498-N3)-methyltransferase